jgi:hypothetical protein
LGPTPLGMRLDEVLEPLPLMLLGLAGANE